MNLQINHIQHIGIPVTNIKTSKSFYLQLGFKDVMNSVFNYKDGQGVVGMMMLGDMIIELYEMPESELHEIRSRKNGHIDHIAFDVDDIEETFRILKEKAFNIVEEQPVFLPFWEKGCKYFNITGPDNERLEFNQIL